MPKKFPKQQPPQPEPTTETTQVPEPTPKRKAKPINPLPPDAVRRMREFYKDSYDIETSILRSMGR